jgi:hypothetical protein
MPAYSHGANYPSIADLRMSCGAASFAALYYANMPRKKRPLPNRGATADWYLPEWMETVGISQAALAKKCGFTNSTMHGIYHGRTSYYRDLLNTVATQLNVEPYELLMPPAFAMALRRQREDSVRIAEETRPLRTAESG